MAEGTELPRISLTRGGIESSLGWIDYSQAGQVAYSDLVSAIEDHGARECTRHRQSHDIANEVVDATIRYAVEGRTIPEIVAGLTKHLRDTGPR